MMRLDNHDKQTDCAFGPRMYNSAVHEKNEKMHEKMDISFVRTVFSMAFRLWCCGAVFM